MSLSICKCVNTTENLWSKYTTLNLLNMTKNIFWSSSEVNFRRCEFFGHVHQFWSNSFGHLDSVKWIFLQVQNIYQKLLADRIICPSLRQFVYFSQNLRFFLIFRTHHLSVTFAKSFTLMKATSLVATLPQKSKTFGTERCDIAGQLRFHWWTHPEMRMSMSLKKWSKRWIAKSGLDEYDKTIKNRRAFLHFCVKI